MPKTVVLLAALLLVFLCGGAMGAPMTFFGEDLSPGGAVPPGGAAAAARDAFLAGLSSPGTEDFEGFAAGSAAPLDLAFPGTSGSITATLGGDGEIDDASGLGRFATSGAKFWEVGTSSAFTIQFSSPVSAFGFFGTDIGDFGGQLELTLAAAGGGEVLLSPPHTQGAGGSTDGALLFFGFIDPVGSYTGITFNNQSIVDVFGFDDMTVADLGQVVEPPGRVPESPTMLLLGLGLLGIAGVRRLAK